MKKPTCIILMAITVCLVNFCSAFAGSATLTLHQNSVTNVYDSAGLWQYVGGKIYIIAPGDKISAIAYIADYTITLRTITGGTDAQNTAMMTMSIFMIGKHPPENLTIQGSYDFSSGNFIGSVSAASSGLKSLIGSSCSGTAGSSGTLTINY